MPDRDPRTRPQSRPALCLLVLLSVAFGADRHAHAQTVQNPVYVDDSTAAADAIAQARARLAAGDPTEAVRLLQEVLEAEGDRLLPTDEDSDLFTMVRSRVHDEMLARPELLARHRALFGPAAAARLTAGDEVGVARDHFLTSPGLDATLRLAERRLEAAQFDAAWRTLEPAVTHPDFQGQRASHAAALLDRIRMYTDAAGAGRLASMFADALDAPEPSAPPRVPAPPLNLGLNTLEAGPSVALDDLVARPLATAPMPRPAPSAEPDPRSTPTRRAAGRFTPLHYVLPTVTPDAVFINDGRTVSAYERFTLGLIWRTDYADDDRRTQTSHVTSGRNAIEDLAAVAVSGRSAVAVGGIATRGVREDDDRAHAFDARTGEPRWSIGVEDLSPTLAEGSFRGPATINQGVAVFGVMKSIKERRLLSFYLVGVDLMSGRPRWTRPLGSSGTLPYGAVAKIADLPVLADGLIYQMDSLGFIAATDTVTGDLRWIRRLPVQNTINPIRRTWDGARPVVHTGVVYTTTPDRRSILALDAETGAILSSRPAADFRDPEYLLAVDGHLVAVGEERITSLAFARFTDGSAAPALILDARASSIDGRVAVAGSRVLVPTPEGVRVARADAAGPEEARLAPLDSTGNLVALESELVAADASRLHTYLIWDTAERVLRERMAASPHDPAPAVTFVELAHRAGRHDRILPAVDAALAAIARNPLDDHNARARSRLFESLWAMVTPDDRNGPDRGVPPELEPALIDRLGQSASTPPQRVRYLLAEGAIHEANDAGEQAVASYQRILDTPTLSETKFESGGVEARADAEAAKGLSRIVRRHGAGVYLAFTAEADRALSSLGRQSDPALYAALAKRYPVAPAASRAWLLAAEQYDRQGRPRRALAALEDGLAAAENALERDPDFLGELTGRLIVALIDAGRLESAAAAIRRARESAVPGLIPTVSGETASLDSLAERVRARRATAGRLPEIGLPQENARTELLAGWIIERALLNPDTQPTTESVLLRSDDAIGLYRTNHTGGVREVWRAPITPGAITLANTWDAVYILEPGERSRRIVKIDRDSGAVEWRGSLSNGFIPADDTGLITLGVFVAMDHRTMAFVRTDGAAEAIDLDTGARLWSRPAVLPAVADAAADADTLIIIGSLDRPQRGQNVQPGRPAALALDLRTGATIDRLEPALGTLRWARLTPDGVVILGGDAGVLAYDLLRERQQWLAEDLAGVRTIDAWPVGDRVVILGDDASLWQIDFGDGRPRARALETLGRLTRTVQIGESPRVAAAGDHLVVASLNGVLAYDRAGELVGAERRADDLPVAIGAIGAAHVVTATINPAFVDAGALWHDLYIISTPSGALAQRRLINLEARPDRVALLDGRILVSAGKAVLVIDAPAP